MNNEIVPAFHEDALAVRPVSMKFWGLTIGKAMAASTVKGPMQPVMPGLNAELAPVKVDHQMATTVPGLFAIGDTCYAGACLAGAVPAPPGRMRGSGLGFATFSGVRCAPAAVAAARAASGRPDAAHAEALKARVVAPLGRSGTEAPEMVRAVQDVMAPVRYSICKSADRMEEALGKVLALKEQVPALAAKDPHYLAACHVAESMVLGAEMFYRASLAREESRGWHLREDFPERDDVNFLKWIELKYTDGEMALSFEDVPVENYPLQPEGTEGEALIKFQLISRRKPGDTQEKYFYEWGIIHVALMIDHAVGDAYLQAVRAALHGQRSGRRAAPVPAVGHGLGQLRRPLAGPPGGQPRALRSPTTTCSACIRTALATPTSSSSTSRRRSAMTRRGSSPEASSSST